MEDIAISKFQVYILCWCIGAFVLVDFIQAASANSFGLAMFDAVMIMFWVCWPFKLVRDGREQLKKLLNE